MYQEDPETACSSNKRMRWDTAFKAHAGFGTSVTLCSIPAWDAVWALWGKSHAEGSFIEFCSEPPMWLDWSAAEIALHNFCVFFCFLIWHWKQLTIDVQVNVAPMRLVGLKIGPKFQLSSPFFRAKTNFPMLSVVSFDGNGLIFQNQLLCRAGPKKVMYKVYEHISEFSTHVTSILSIWLLSSIFRSVPKVSNIAMCELVLHSGSACHRRNCCWGDRSDYGRWRGLRRCNKVTFVDDATWSIVHNSVALLIYSRSRSTSPILNKLQIQIKFTIIRSRRYNPLPRLSADLL